MRKVPTKPELTQALNEALQVHYGKVWSDEVRAEIENQVRVFLNKKLVDPKDIWVYIDDEGLVCISASGYTNIDTGKN